MYPFSKERRTKNFGFAFLLKPGNICAVLGESGCWKIYFIKILVGYSSPSRVVSDWMEFQIGNWNKRELCDHIGYLPQEIQLFGGEDN